MTDCIYTVIGLTDVIYKECLQMFFKRQKAVGNEQIGTSHKTTSMEPETI